MFGVKDFEKHLTKSEEIGFVEEVLYSIAYVSGLPGAMSDEIVIFENGGFGEVIAVKTDLLEILVFTETESIRVGSKATRTGKVFEIPVGKELLGRTIDPLCKPLDGKPLGPLKDLQKLDIAAPGIDSRSRIKKSLNTGEALVDTLIPIGKGQRELIIGDRKTGKTNFLIKSIISQAKEGTICIYAGIGRKIFDVKKVEETLRKEGVLKDTIIVVSNSQDPSGLIYLAPYSAMAIAEYFKDQGRDVLLILDDLTSHAKFCREIALLGKRFPGRNSYPADIFHTHSRLLERAGNFSINGNDASITCFPVAETTQGDLSGYIQTNLMSMTDGHLFFDSDLFVAGRRPAVNPFLSVTRVGHQTQSQVRRSIAREIISFLTLFEKMQRFTHFGAETTDTVKNIIETGTRLNRFFNHSSQFTLSPNVQTFLLTLLWKGMWNDKDLLEMEKDIEKMSHQYLNHATFRKNVDEVIDKASTFNDLLGLVEANEGFLKKKGFTR
jgi:F-type H+/Na+-transporting ATPase subunit alpha